MNALVSCSGCRYALDNPNHPAIKFCSVGVPSGAATAGWFDTDRHFCDAREEGPSGGDVLVTLHLLDMGVQNRPFEGLSCSS